MNEQHATLRFHAELNDFIPQARRHGAIVHDFRGRVSIKDMIESLGVPHTEVVALLVNGRSHDFSYLVSDADQIDVYPISAAAAAAPYLPLRPPVPFPPRFILDTHLGQLASYLRMLGFDTLYRNDYEDSQLAAIASAQERILLTRDRGLLKRGILVYAYYVRETDPRRQVDEIVRRYELAPAIEPFRRCIRCNGLLHQVPKDQIAERLEPKTREHYQEFSQCGSCGHIYWKGSHVQKIEQLVYSALCQNRLG